MYIYLAEKPYAFGEDLDRERRVDCAADRTPIGIELTCLSRGVDLRDLPSRDAVTALLAGLHIKVFA